MRLPSAVLPVALLLHLVSAAPALAQPDPGPAPGPVERFGGDLRELDLHLPSSLPWLEGTPPPQAQAAPASEDDEGFHLIPRARYWRVTQDGRLRITKGGAEGSGSTVDLSSDLQLEDL